MFLTIITFLAVISVLVFVHELGHFAVARWIGVGVEEFGFGLPPRIWGKKVKGTIYSVNWLPIGGFVKLMGEDNDSEQAGSKTQDPKSKYFWARSKKERAAILLAGVTMNFLLAVTVTAFLLTHGIYEPSGTVHVDGIAAGSPAEKAGLRIHDVIRSVSFPIGPTYQSRQLTLPKELIDTTKAHVGEELRLTVIRDGNELIVPVVPRKESPQGEGPMGVVISDVELRKYPWDKAPYEALRINIKRGWQMLVTIVVALWRLVTLQPIREQVAGPIGIAQVTGQAVRYGFGAVLELLSVLSLNLAVLNLLPIPALDGGRLVFVFVEKVLGRRVRPAFETSTHQIGMIILFMLIILISINDILRLAGGS